MLAGMYAPRNFGPEYAAKFDPIYPDLAKAYDVPLYPFFLDGVAGEAKLNLPDGIHPTAEGIDVIVSRILPVGRGVPDQGFGGAALKNRHKTPAPRRFAARPGFVIKSYRQFVAI